VTFVVDHEERIRRCNVTIRQLAEELIEAKRRDGKARRYLESLRGYLGRFCQEFGERLIATVTPEELDTWLRDLPYSPKSRLNYRQHIGVLFSYAKRRRMIDSNPIEFTERPKLIDQAPEIFTVDELRALLDTAARIEPNVVPMLAIGAFAGLRDSEIQQLEWSEVNQARGFIEVKAAKAKSARRRLVPIQPNLAAWLQPYSGLAGAVVPGADTQSALRRDPARNKLLGVREAAGITEWPKNGLRHSFCSYRLAATNNAHLVASELGHTTTQLVYQHYREVVTPEEAQRYWKIEPAAETANVVAFTAAAQPQK
jgi:integrase